MPVKRKALPLVTAVLAIVLVGICLPGRTFAQSTIECKADLDCDGDVDASDLSVLAQQFGVTNGVPSAPGCVPIVDLSEYRDAENLRKTYNTEEYDSEEIVTGNMTSEWNENLWTWTFSDSQGEITEVWEFDDVETPVGRGSTAFRLVRSGQIQYQEVYTEPFVGLFGNRRIGEIYSVNYTWKVTSFDPLDSYWHGHVRTYTVETIEDVTVPAGIFEDCVKIVSTFPGQHRVYWYAKGVGLVKWIYYRQPGLMKWELRSYEPLDS